jgi:hypothetical protein
MPRNLERWTVLPHDAPRQVTDDIITVVGEIEMPLMTLPRRMTVVGAFAVRGGTAGTVTVEYDASTARASRPSLDENGRSTRGAKGGRRNGSKKPS